uniref:RRM domain-containing protein n=1 Tax=Nothobranchius furzeri TaxID=105023 RepID=A0A8C6P5W3_NOTFU
MFCSRQTKLSARLSYRAREKDVERFFKGYGKILEVDLKNGYGFVEFDDPRDADDAVYDLNGKELCGERVIVEHTKGPRRDGGYSGGRSEYPACICSLYMNVIDLIKNNVSLFLVADEHVKLRLV